MLAGRKSPEEIVAAGEVGKSGIACVWVGGTAVGEIAIVSLTRPLGTGRIDLAAVETRALLRIAQQVIGGRNLLELLLRLLIAGIEVRVQFLPAADRPFGYPPGRRPFSRPASDRDRRATCSPAIPFARERSRPTARLQQSHSGSAAVHLRGRLLLSGCVGDKDAGGSQEPIVDRVTVLRYAHDRAGRLRRIIHLHHRLMQSRIEAAWPSASIF